MVQGWLDGDTGGGKGRVNKDRWRLESMAANECHDKPIQSVDIKEAS